MQRIRSEFDPMAERGAELQRLARKFKLSTLVVLRQIHQAGYPSWEEYRRSHFDEYAPAMETPRGGGADSCNTQSVRVSRTFARAVVASTLDGHTPFTDAFQMLGFKKTVDVLRVGGSARSYVTSYLLHTDVFIRAKNQQYGFDLCPGFWNWIDREQPAGKVFSIQRVYYERLDGQDELSNWATQRLPLPCTDFPRVSPLG